MLQINDRIQVPLREFSFTFTRSSGPGGQNVNKVNTKAVLRWSLAGSRSLPDDVRQRFVEKYRRRVTGEGDVVIASDRFRDQGRNVADCLEKLRAMLAEVAVRPKRRKPTKPSRAAVAQRLESKRRLKQKKQARRTVGE